MSRPQHWDDPQWWNGTRLANGKERPHRAPQSLLVGMTDAEICRARLNKANNVWGGVVKASAASTLIRPHPVYALTNHGRLVHRIAFVIAREGRYRPHTHVEYWCSARRYTWGSGAEWTYPATPDFVCKRCEDRATHLGYPSSAAFPERGCEAWQGERYTAPEPDLTYPLVFTS